MKAEIICREKLEVQQPFFQVQGPALEEPFDSTTAFFHKLVCFARKYTHCYAYRVKEVINQKSIKRDHNMEFPEAWIPIIKKHNKRRAV